MTIDDLLYDLFILIGDLEVLGGIDARGISLSQMVGALILILIVFTYCYICESGIYADIH